MYMTHWCMYIHVYRVNCIVYMYTDCTCSFAHAVFQVCDITAAARCDLCHLFRFSPAGLEFPLPIAIHFSSRVIWWPMESFSFSFSSHQWLAYDTLCSALCHCVFCTPLNIFEHIWTHLELCFVINVGSVCFLRQQNVPCLFRCCYLSCMVNGPPMYL